MAVQLDPVCGALRALRSSLLATTSATLAVTAHALGGGAAPDSVLTGLLVVLIAAIGTAFADRRRSTTSILLALATAQLARHLLLSALSVHQHEAATPAVLSGLVPMVTAHAVATSATALLLGGAESAIFGMAAALGAVLPRRSPQAPVFAPQRAVAPAFAGLVDVLDVLLRRANARRGPPLTS